MSDGAARCENLIQVKECSARIASESGEKSLMLLALLAKEAGGWGMCKLPSERERSRPRDEATAALRADESIRAPAVFASTADPGYQSILAMIVAGREFLERDSTRFDMAHFKPRPDWVREMKRYGVVPECVKPEEVTDAYAIEQDYWKSLWHRPTATSLPFDARNN